MARGAFRLVVKTNKLPRYHREARRLAWGAVLATAVAIEQDVKGVGPHAAPIRTGNLRRSYHIEQHPEELRARVGSDPGVAPYAIYVELGTRHMAARPHLIPAAEAQRGPFERRLIAALGAK